MIEDDMIQMTNDHARKNLSGISLQSSVGNFSPDMRARNQVGTGLSYRPASLCSLATQFQTHPFLESIPRPIAGLKFSTREWLQQRY
jgi:hypothetical protein